MSRRNIYGRRGGVRFGGATLTASLMMYGTLTPTTSDYLITANPGGEAGLDNDWGVAGVMRVASASSGTRVVFARSPYDIRINASNQLQMFVGAVASPAYAIGSNTNKWLHWAFVYDKTAALLRTYIGGVEVGAGTALANYTAVAASTYWGRRSDSFAAAGVAIAGLTQFRGRPTGAELIAHYNACKAANDVVDMTGTAVTKTHTYSVKNNRASIATISDLAGADNFTAVGTPTLYAELNPSWV